MRTKNLFIALAMLALTASSVFAQYDLPKTSGGDYQTVTLFNLVNKADTAYSAVYKTPYNVTQIIFEGVADTVTASDSLIVVIQGSPTGTVIGPWFTHAVWRCGVLGEANRQIIIGADRYIRALYQCKGSAIANDFRCYITPKN